MLDQAEIATDVMFHTRPLLLAILALIFGPPRRGRTCPPKTSWGFLGRKLHPSVQAQVAARHADPRTTTIYDRRRENFDRHAAYVVVAFVAGG